VLKDSLEDIKGTGEDWHGAIYLEFKNCCEKRGVRLQLEIVV
jgi:hypothetical protein